jgi:hypothetical protein
VFEGSISLYKNYIKTSQFGRDSIVLITCLLTFLHRHETLIDDIKKRRPSDKRKSSSLNKKCPRKVFSMNNNSTLTLEFLQNKLQQLNLEVANIKKLEEAREHLVYLINNFSIFSKSHEQLSLISSQKQNIYDKNLPTRLLVIDILKTEGRRMRWSEVYEVVKSVKPEIQLSTTRFWLSKVSIDRTSNIRKDNGFFWYEKS